VEHALCAHVLSITALGQRVLVTLGRERAVFERELARHGPTTQEGYGYGTGDVDGFLGDGSGSVAVRLGDRCDGHRFDVAVVLDTGFVRLHRRVRLLRRSPAATEDRAGGGGSEGGYINFMSGDDAYRAADNYGANYERLAAVKAVYDPDNVFHVNQNIAPAKRR
jgi:Berberine and berberine like